MNFDFEYFNNQIESQKIEIVNKHQSANYVLMVLINGLPIDQINYEAFDEDDVIDTYLSLDEAITNESIEGEITLDPNHSYTRMIALRSKIYEMENLEKFRPPSPFSFL